MAYGFFLKAQVIFSFRMQIMAQRRPLLESIGCLFFCDPPQTTYRQSKTWWYRYHMQQKEINYDGCPLLE